MTLPRFIRASSYRVQSSEMNSWLNESFNDVKSPELNAACCRNLDSTNRMRLAISIARLPDLNFILGAAFTKGMSVVHLEEPDVAIG